MDLDTLTPRWTIRLTIQLIEYDKFTSFSCFIYFTLDESNIIDKCTYKLEAVSIFEPPY